MSSPVSARKRRSCTVTPCVDAVPTSSAPRSASWAAQATYPWVPPTAKWAPRPRDRNSGPTAADLGPPDEPVNDEGCDYKLSYEENLKMGYECYRLPPLGGVRTPDVANEPDGGPALSVSGRRLPPAQYRDELEPYYQKWYDSAPLRWGFEEGTFYPYWELVSSGMPNFAVKKHCYLDAFSGRYQLCSAYPWNKRPDDPRCARAFGTFRARHRRPDVRGERRRFDRAGHAPEHVSAGEQRRGRLGVALTRLSDGSRMAVRPRRARRHWETLGWTGAELEAMRGEKFTLDVYDYRANDWGWAAVDNFVVPAAWIQAVTPTRRAARGTLIEIVGKNFGNSADGIVVFIGHKECTSLGMTQSGSLSCITPPGDGAGVTVSVVIGITTGSCSRAPSEDTRRDTAETRAWSIRSHRARWVGASLGSWRA